MSRFIVMDRAAQMPSTVRSPYRRVAVVEVDLPEGEEPKMISARAKGVVRIVRTWERQYAGATERCAFQRALAEAGEMAALLNEKDPHKTRMLMATVTYADTTPRTVPVFTKQVES